MSVYVDNANIRYGRMLMSHMIGDSLEEMHEMADRIGVARRHFQGDHYDICKSKREKAIAFGAVPVSQRELAKIRRVNSKLTPTKLLVLKGGVRR